MRLTRKFIAITDSIRSRLTFLSATFFLGPMLLVSCTKEPEFPPSYYDCEDGGMGDPGITGYEDLLNDRVASGVPGVMMTVKNEEGIWSGAAGKADLASDLPMKPCNITRVGSTVKTFTAVTILLLQEEGKLNIDDPITDYLPKEYLDGLENAQSVTIRQLLQHSSGIYNYIANPRFQTASLNDLERIWYPDDLLVYARNEPADFPPGEDVRYSNTNYILLGDIIEAVENRPFYKVFEEKLFRPLGLSYTRFAAEDPVPEGIVRGYVDFYSNLNVINATYYSGWDYFTADGGLISNTYDLNRFLSALFNGQILDETSLKEMTSWQSPASQDEEGYDTYYGLGIFKIVTDYGPAYLHSGDAIGYFASMVYFPDQKVTLSWAVNGNYGAIDKHTQSKEAMDKIFERVLGPSSPQ